MDLARFIDHTLLKPEAAEGDIRRLVAEALEYRFISVCVNGRWVKLAAELIRGAGADVGVRNMKVCAVAGFPLGAGKGSVKAAEGVAAVQDGAGEVDMVVSLGLLLDEKEGEVREDIAQVVEAVKLAKSDALVKVIMETAALTEEQTAMGCRAARAAGADFVKTSTGFHSKGGATVQAVRWLAKYGLGMGVKASGGIKDRQVAEAMIAAGATRLGTSSGVAIIKGNVATSAF
jgi:deoxyribose-phosphate aldolase